MENEKLIKELNTKKAELQNLVYRQLALYKSPMIWLVPMILSYILFVVFFFVYYSIPQTVFFWLFIAFLICGIVLMVFALVRVGRNIPINVRVKRYRNIIAQINRKIDQIKNGTYVDPRKKLVTSSNISIADEIVKFKKLVDDGVITKEEFEAKKKQLLDL